MTQEQKQEPVVNWENRDAYDYNGVLLNKKQMKYKTQQEGVVTIKDNKGNLIGIIYKDGANPPITYMTEVASIDELVEFMGCTLLTESIDWTKATSVPTNQLEQ